MRMAQQLQEPRLVIQGRDRDQQIPKRPQRPVEMMIEMSPAAPQSHIHRSTHTNKGIAPIHPDEDPKLQLGSKPPAKEISMPATQQDCMTSGGVNIENTGVGDTSPDGDRDTGALYLTVNTPCSY